MTGNEIAGSKEVHIVGPFDRPQIAHSESYSELHSHWQGSRSRNLPGVGNYQLKKYTTWGTGWVARLVGALSLVPRVCGFDPW